MFVSTEELNKGLLNQLQEEQKKYWQGVNELREDIIRQYSNLPSNQVCYSLTINPNREISKESLNTINVDIFSRLKSYTLKNSENRKLFQGFVAFEKSRDKDQYHMHYILVFPTEREEYITRKLPEIVDKYIPSASIDLQLIVSNEDKKGWIKYITKDFNPHSLNGCFDYLSNK